jgi:hypothetical protein
MSGSGKGGNNRKNRQRFSGRREESPKHGKKQNDNIFFLVMFEKSRLSLHERPRWTAPVLPINPITTPDCPWCGKQIKDITTAISDKDTGLPVHFDCVLSRIAEMENLDPNDNVCYIGGGRFGIIHYNNLPDTRDFFIKKILEWENKDIDNEWRRPISEYFSIT